MKKSVTVLKSATPPARSDSSYSYNMPFKEDGFFMIITEEEYERLKIKISG